MFGGGSGDSRKMKKMMNQMGIDLEEIEDVEEVVIRTASKELVFNDADVTKMEAQGQQTYQVVGEPSEEGRVDSGDIELVAERAGVSEDEAREALEEAGGDLAQAISSLE